MRTRPLPPDSDTWLCGRDLPPPTGPSRTADWMLVGVALLMAAAIAGRAVL